jgi:hypothetical protein
MVDERDLPEDGTVGAALDHPTAREGARHADRRTMRWRLVLVGLSVAGSVVSIASLLAGHWTVALRLLLATLVILGGLLLQAVL